MPVQVIFLSLPIKAGTSFDGWLITDIDLEVETPFETFHQITVLTKDNDGEKIRRYYTPGLDLVRETRAMGTEKFPIETTSLIQHLEYR